MVSLDIYIPSATMGLSYTQRRLPMHTVFVIPASISSTCLESGVRSSETIL